MSQDNGNWLSAEQAVLPDGTLRENLPLVNKKLPLFSSEQAPAAAPDSNGDVVETPPQD